MVKLAVLPPSATAEGGKRQFCLYCRSEAVAWHRNSNGVRYVVCSTCGRTETRCIVLDPDINWWTDIDDEYWHATAGVFVQRDDGRYLFFNRTAHPFGLTIPAGHIGAREAPLQAAMRELEEETGVTVRTLRLMGEISIPGDECRRGSDHHHWHVFRHDYDHQPVRLNEEGDAPVWYTLNEAASRHVIYAVARLIDHFGGLLDAR